MHKATKGALATLSGAVLLLGGGGGTLAVWTQDTPVGGGPITSGSLALATDATRTGCGAWVLDAGEPTQATYSPGDPLVPGDVLTRRCSFAVEAVGDHMRASVDVSEAVFSGSDGDFGGTLAAEVSDVEVDGVPVTSFTDEDDGKTLTASVVVTFASTAGNGTANLETVLDEVVLTATQVHD